MDSADIPFAPKGEESIPLVVPDATPEKSFHVRGREAAAAKGLSCVGTKKNGDPCGWIVGKPGDYCYIHDPTITPETRHTNRSKRIFPKLSGKRHVKTKEDVLKLVSARLDQWVAQWNTALTPETEATFCQLVNTYCNVYKCTSDEAALGVAHWSLKRRQA